MRNAAATFDDDLSYDRPVRKKAARPRSGATPGKTRKKRVAGKIGTVAKYGAVGLSATLAVAIMVNALMMQKSRHPAPLFGEAIASKTASPGDPPPARTETARATTPVKEATPAIEASVSKPDTNPVPMPVAKPVRPSVKNASNTKAVVGDPIARLLRSSTAATAGPEEKQDVKTVLATQKALVKLGFVLKPNGTLGPATRKSLEMFEKAHNLPVKGALSPRLVKVLSAESGVKID